MINNLDISSRFSAGSKIRCTKISGKNSSDLPDNFWVEGRLFSDVVLGRPVKIVRSRRARKEESEPEVVECFGLFVTSEVKAFDRNEECPTSVIVETENSYWRMDLL